MKITPLLGVTTCLMYALILQTSLSAQKSSLFAPYNGQGLVINDSIVPRICSDREWCDVILSGTPDEVKDHIMAEIAYVQNRKDNGQHVNLDRLTHVNSPVATSEGIVFKRYYDALTYAVLKHKIELINVLLLHPSINIIPAWRVAKGMIANPNNLYFKGQTYVQELIAVRRLFETCMVARGITTIWDDVCEACIIS